MIAGLRPASPVAEADLPALAFGGRSEQWLPVGMACPGRLALVVLGRPGCQ
jgi:hypothetical protein